jgi:leucyl/phenylalanyl-tRNA--protein transferase
MILPLRKDPLWFPDTVLADEDGLLAFGGDLSEQRLVKAYSKGIFPWYSDETPILWYAPPERFVLFPDELKISKSMKQVMKSGKFELKMNTSFEKVIELCARVKRSDSNGTWITNDMKEAYIQLHEAGHAHSVEAWYNGELAGGLYGVKSGRIFCGESMFSLVPNASKAALIFLCQTGNYAMIDCQVYTEHLESMGARLISREEFEDYLGKFAR